MIDDMIENHWGQYSGAVPQDKSDSGEAADYVASLFISITVLGS